MTAGALKSKQVKSAAGTSHYEESHYSPTFESQALVSPGLVTLWLHPASLTVGAAGQLERPDTCVEVDHQPLDLCTVDCVQVRDMADTPGDLAAALAAHNTTAIKVGSNVLNCAVNC